MAFDSGVISEKTSGRVFFTNGVKPLGFWSRFRGLQWRESLSPDAAWWFDNCKSVHTFAVRNNLDLVFLSSDKVVIKVLHNVPPRRIAYCSGGRSVIEMRAGMARKLNFTLNMQMVWSDE